MEMLPVQQSPIKSRVASFLTGKSLCRSQLPVFVDSGQNLFCLKHQQRLEDASVKSVLKNKKRV